ncbi:MAG: ATP-binding protein [Aggregatilineales bacterium]
MDDLSRQPVADQLTQRELEILGLIVEGLSNAEIAQKLFLSSATVKVHTRHIYGKLGVNSRTQAVAATRVSGLLDGTSATVELSTPLHNLPHQPTPFIGRTTELAAIARRLEDPACRLLTVVGPGGIGKTRLALQAAKQQFAAFAQGVYFVSLAPLNAPEAVVSTIAEAIRFSFYPGGEPRQQLLDFLRARQLLLVLDNFEHLLTAASLVVDILEAAPRVRILVTSRERLNIQAETVFSLGGMAYPPQEFAAEAAEYGAVKLFLQSAAQVQPDFPLTIGNLEGIANICRQVQGMPLGILLAAAWVGVLSVQEIGQEIQKSLNFLKTEQRDLPERQRSLQAAFDHSWRLLAEEERTAFKRLSVFRGGFTREAAQQVADASLKSLMNLVNKSLLRRDATTGRYEIHELLRQFGEAQLNRSPQEREHAHQLHCEFYVDYMQQQWKAMKSLKQGAVFDEIGVDFNNVLAAWNDAVGKHRTDLLRGMALPLWDYCDYRAPHAEAAALFGQAAQVLQAAPLMRETEIALGLMLALQGWLTDYLPASLTQGKALIEKSLVILRKYDCPEEMVVALYALAVNTGYSLRQFSESKQAASEGLRIAQENHIQWAIGRCFFMLGYCLWAEGDLVQARQSGIEGLSASQAISDLHIMAANAAFVLGPVAMDLKDYAEAERQLEQGLRWYKEIETSWHSALSYFYLGQVALLTQDYRKAEYCLQQTALLLQKTGRVRERLHYEALCAVSKLFTAQGRPEDAVALLALIRHQMHNQNLANPAGHQFIRDLAAASLTELQAALPEEVYAAAVERGKSLDFDSVVDEFLAE